MATAKKEEKVTYPQLVSAEAVNGKKQVNWVISADEGYNVEGTFTWTKMTEIMFSSMTIGGTTEAQMKRSMRLLFSLISEDDFYAITEHYIEKGEEDLPDDFIENLVKIFVGDIVPKAIETS